MPLDYQSLNGFALATTAVLRSARLSLNSSDGEPAPAAELVLELGLGALSANLQAHADAVIAEEGRPPIDGALGLESELMLLLRTSLRKRPWVLEVADGPSGRVGLGANGVVTRRERALGTILKAMKDPALAGVVLDAGSVGHELAPLVRTLQAHRGASETPIVVRNLPDEAALAAAHALGVCAVEPLGAHGFGGWLVDDCIADRVGLWPALSLDDRDLTVAGLEDLGDAMLALARANHGRCSAQLLYVDAEPAARRVNLSGAYPVISGEIDEAVHRWLWSELADGLVALVPPRLAAPSPDWAQTIERLVLPGRRSFEVRGAGVAHLRRGEGFGRAIRRARQAARMGSVSSGAWAIGSHRGAQTA